MVCGSCSKIMAKSAQFFGCKPCKVTMCGDCFHVGGTAATTATGAGAGSMLDCREKHGLKQYNTPNASFSCDKCRKGMQKGDAFRGCKPCKMTVCLPCFQNGAAASK
jgi:hypothetical protein